MPGMKSVALALVLAAAPLAAAGADCQSEHNHTCAHPGASCGTQRNPGHCQTILRPGWPRRTYLCACHPIHPHR